MKNPATAKSQGAFARNTSVPCLVLGTLRSGRGALMKSVICEIRDRPSYLITARTANCEYAALVGSLQPNNTASLSLKDDPMQPLDPLRIFVSTLIGENA